MILLEFSSQPIARPDESLPSTSFQIKEENPPLLPQVEMIVIGTFEESTTATTEKRTKNVLAIQQTYDHQVSTSQRLERTFLFSQSGEQITQ